VAAQRRQRVAHHPRVEDAQMFEMFAHFFGLQGGVIFMRTSFIGHADFLLLMSL